MVTIGRDSFKHLACAAFALFLIFAMNLAHGQTVYKCVDAKRQWFQSGGCVGQNTTQSFFAPLSAADRRAIAKNMNASIKDISELEAQCLRGFSHICQVLDTYKQKTAAQALAEDAKAARDQCAKGHQASCDALSWGETLERQQKEGAARAGQELVDRRYWPRCELGVKTECEKVKTYYKRLCATGDRHACDCAAGDMQTCKILSQRSGK
jgi:hypothetical protein